MVIITENSYFFKKKRPVSRPLWSALLPSCGAYDFTHIPYGGCLLSGFKFILSAFVFEVGGLCAAVDAHNVPAPASFLFKQARSSAAWAVQQINSFVNVHTTSP